MRNLVAFGWSVLVLGATARAETLSFPAVWQKVSGASPALEAARLQTESALEAQGKAGRHWLPRLYLDARTYRTNDPGNSFFGLLEQKSLRATDFNPDLMNSPESLSFTRGALGADLPLYEGGMKSAQVELLAHSVEAQKSAAAQTRIEQYAVVGQSYGAIGVLDKELTQLRELAGELERLSRDYKLGGKSNPVGYSGLLGMKALGNRVRGMISQYEAQKLAHTEALREMGLAETRWSPEKMETSLFVERYFGEEAAGGSVETAPSFRTEAVRGQALASREMANMEKARFLPRVGAFAEASSFGGSRGTAGAVTAGLYLQWSLFDPSSYGSVKEARLKALAADKQAEALEKNERAERAAVAESRKALRESVGLLTDSQRLLVEQSKTMMTLFRNGSVNTLQILEVFDRRAELIGRQTEAELGLLKAGTQSATQQKFDIETKLNSGAHHEK